MFHVVGHTSERTTLLAWENMTPRQHNTRNTKINATKQTNGLNIKQSERGRQTRWQQRVIAMTRNIHRHNDTCANTIESNSRRLGFHVQMSNHSAVQAPAEARPSSIPNTG